MTAGQFVAKGRIFTFSKKVKGGRVAGGWGEPSMAHNIAPALETEGF